MFANDENESLFKVRKRRIHLENLFELQSRYNLDSFISGIPHSPFPIPHSPFPVLVTSIFTRDEVKIVIDEPEHETSCGFHEIISKDVKYVARLYHKI